MNIDSILSEAQSVASEFGLRLKIVDITDHIVNLRLYIDVFTDKKVNIKGFAVKALKLLGKIEML